MSRVIIFSRVFPAYHPRKGEPTYFMEALQGSLFNLGYDLSAFIKHPETHMKNNEWAKTPKNHTIRSGSRWKVGDKFSPRVWSGKPYASKMITIAPDIEIKKIWEFMIDDGTAYIHNGKNLWNPLSYGDLKNIATNDGLSIEELKQWFKWPKNGTYQIICWNESINY